MDVINRLDPVEYDQTFKLVEQYTEDTPQLHQCGFIAQSVQQIEDLKHVVIGGEIGEDGKRSHQMFRLKDCIHLRRQSNSRVAQIGRATTSTDRCTKATH